MGACLFNYYSSSAGVSTAASILRSGHGQTTNCLSCILDEEARETLWRFHGFTDETQKDRRRLGRCSLYAAHGQSRWLATTLARAERPQRLQDLRAGHGRASRRHAQ